MSRRQRRNADVDALAHVAASNAALGANGERHQLRASDPPAGGPPRRGGFGCWCCGPMSNVCGLRLALAFIMHVEYLWPAGEPREGFCDALNAVLTEFCVNEH